MGSWGTALYSNDTSSDVLDMCNEVYPLVGIEEGTKLILKEYADKIESFQIKAGFIDGGVIDAAAVNELASTPSKEEMLCKIMGSMMGPLYGLAYVLQAKIDKEEPGEQAEA